MRLTVETVAERFAIICAVLLIITGVAMYSIPAALVVSGLALLASLIDFTRRRQ